MFTVKKEMKLMPTEIADVNKYDGEGLYLVDDGVAYMLVTVYNGYCTTMLVERKYIVKHKQAIGESGIELLQKQLSELNYMIKKLTETTDSIADDNSDMSWQNQVLNLLQNHGKSSDVDLAGLTKLIAVAQKPELIK